MSKTLVLTILFVAACGDDDLPLSDGGIADGRTGDVAILDAGPNRNRERRVEQIFDVPLVDGASALLELVVPENAISIGVTLGDGTTMDRLFVCEWSGPDDEVIVTADWDEYTTSTRCVRECSNPACDVRSTCPNPVPSGRGLATAVLPSGPLRLPAAGTHHIRVCAKGTLTHPEHVPMHILTRIGERPTSGVLHLNLFFTGNAGLTANTAPDNARFQMVIAGVRAIFSAIDVALEITYQDIADPGTVSASERPPWLGDIPPSTPMGIHVFFVGSLDEPGVLGFATNTPGSFGTALDDAVVIRVDDTTEYETLDGVVAHEIGHHLGLPHTTEQGIISQEDPFTDTVTGDERLLMFFGNGGGTYISPQQREIILRSPHLRTR